MWLKDNFGPVALEHEAAAVRVVSGAVPESLQGGMYLRNGPNPRWTAEGRPYHWFDGDGMVHGIYFDSLAAPKYVNKYIRNPKFHLENTFQAPTLPGVAHALSTSFIPVMKFVASSTLSKWLGDKVSGTNNTSLIHFGRRLLALMEMDKPIWMKAPSLNTVGERKFKGDQDGRVTAHPKICPNTGNLYYISYSLNAPFLTYAIASPKHEIILPRTPIPAADRPVMMHDFAITEHYAIFLDLPLIFNPSKNIKAGKPCLDFDATQRSRYIFVERETAKLVAVIETEPHMIFHTANAFENSLNEVVLRACRSESTSLDLDLGVSETGNRDPYLTELTFDIGKKTVQVERLCPVVAEFPVINPKYLTNPSSRYIYMAEGAKELNPLFKGVIKVDTHLKSHMIYSLPSAMYTTEVLFVPSPRATEENDGYLIAFMSANDSRSKAFVMIVNAQTMEQEALLECPARVPFGFHGLWMSKDDIHGQEAAHELRSMTVNLSWWEWGIMKIVQWLTR